MEWAERDALIRKDGAREKIETDLVRPANKGETVNKRGNSGTTRRVGEEKREMEGNGRIYIDRNYPPTPRLCLPQHRLSSPTFFPVLSPTHPLSAYLGIHIYNRGSPTLVSPIAPTARSPLKSLLSSPGHKITPAI